MAADRQMAHVQTYAIGKERPGSSERCAATSLMPEVCQAT